MINTIHENAQKAKLVKKSELHQREVPAKCFHNQLMVGQARKTARSLCKKQSQQQSRILSSEVCFIDLCLFQAKSQEHNQRTFHSHAKSRKRPRGPKTSAEQPLQINSQFEFNQATTHWLPNRPQPPQNLNHTQDHTQPVSNRHKSAQTFGTQIS